MRSTFASVVRTFRSPINKSSESLKAIFVLILIITIFFLFNVSDFGIAKKLKTWTNGSTWVLSDTSTSTRNKSMKIPRLVAGNNVRTSIQVDLRPITGADHTSSTALLFQGSISDLLQQTSTTEHAQSTTSTVNTTTTTQEPVKLSKIHYNKSGKNHPRAVAKVTFYEKSESSKLKVKNIKETVEEKAHNKKAKPGWKGKPGSNSKFNSLTVFRDGHLMKLAQDDSKLIAFIRKYHLTPPSTMPYKLKHIKALTTKEQRNRRNKKTELNIVLQLLGNKKNGFFIECGASDYGLKSNTLNFEREYNWTGLLVEPDPIHLAELYEKHRKAWITNTCLSGEPYPQVVTMRRRKENIVQEEKENSTQTSLVQNSFNASCLPLFSILSAIDTTQVDFFRLDVGMIGLAILKTIPFEMVSIKVLAVGMPDALKHIQIPFVESKGYVCLMNIRGSRTNDYIFIQRSLYEESMEQNCYKNTKSTKKRGKHHRK